MLALTFLLPWVLAAAGAAAAPVVIHFILRTRPRPIFFPAMRFVKKTHRASISKLRLKQLLLLAMRVAIIVLLALLIARPIVESRLAARSESPAAAVLLIDNSGSMGYRYQGRSRLDEARQAAVEIIESLPSGSRVAVLTTARPQQGVGFLADRQLAVGQAAQVVQTPSAAAVRPAVARAAELLADQGIADRRVYILTDLTAQGWRDSAGDPFGERSASFYVLDCGRGRDANAAIASVRLGSQAAPVGSEVSIGAVLRSRSIGGEMPVRVELAGRAVSERTVRLIADGQAALGAEVRLEQTGVRQGQLVLVNPDGLEMDNVRYFTIDAGSPASITIAAEPTAAAMAGSAAFLMSSAVDPGGAGTRQGVRRRTIPADELDADAAGGGRAVMLADVAAPTAEQWAMLEQYVRSGAGLWIVLGRSVVPAAYNAAAAQRVMPVALGGLMRLDPPVAWEPVDAGDALLQPFVGEQNPPLSEVRCGGRYAIESVDSDARVIVRYADGAPAIVSARRGEGQVLLWNFSPAREMSSLARLEQFPILVQRAAKLLVSDPEIRTMYGYGETVTVPLPQGAPAPIVTVYRPGREMGEPVVAELRTRTVTLQADELGHWKVSFDVDGTTSVRGFSVNADPEESDLSPAGRERIEAMFPGGVTIAQEVDGLVADAAARQGALALGPPLLLVLLVLLVGESMFANRFYRRGPDTPQLDQAADTDEMH